MPRSQCQARAHRGPAPFLVTALVVIAAVPVGADPARIWPGAIELGLAGALTSIEGTTRATMEVRAGTFVAVSSGLAGLELETQYHHQRALDAVDLQGAISWQQPIADGAAYPFVTVGGGVREEKLGSFSQARYPIGLGLGLRVLFGPRAAIRVEYRYRRVLGDPVAGFNEHQVLSGISLLLRNDIAKTER
jgi:hypothetical protein